MKVAAYQAPLAATGSNRILDLIREAVEECESRGIAILFCPEGVLGGLADYAHRPLDMAIDPANGRLDAVLAPLSSERVTTIVGFTERDGAGRLFNAAAVHHRGAVLGIYRKLHPAINRSVYQAGDSMPVFTVDGLTFGIVICRDSNVAEPARVMATGGATALFVPTNNSLPPAKAGVEVVEQARSADIARATENGMWVIRADVAGSSGGLVSYGSSGIVDPSGRLVQSARRLREDLVTADLGVADRSIAGARPGGVRPGTGQG